MEHSASIWTVYSLTQVINISITTQCQVRVFTRVAFSVCVAGASVHVENLQLFFHIRFHCRGAGEDRFSRHSAVYARQVRAIVNIAYE